MALKDHAPTDARRPSGKPCSVQELIDSLDDDDRAEFLSWLKDGYSQEVIYASVKKANLSCGKQTINRHRARSCRCYL